MRQYQKYCQRAAAGGVCGACGTAGLVNGGKSIPLKKLRFFILRTDSHSTSMYARFHRELQRASSVKERAIAQFKIDTLHTYEHKGNVYHLVGEGVTQVNGSTCCNTCNTCYTTLQAFVEKVDKWDLDVVIRLSKTVEKETILGDDSVVYRPPVNTFSDWDFGRIIMEYVDDNGQRKELQALSPIERQALCKLIVGADIHEVKDAMDVNFACRLKGQTIVMPCNLAEMLHEYSVKTLPRRDLPKWVKILFQGRKKCYTSKMAAELNGGRARMDYEEVRRHLLRLKQLGVYSDIDIASKAECNWSQNKCTIQQEIAVLNDPRAVVAQAQRSSDIARQWDTDCTHSQARGAPSQADFSVVMSTNAMTTAANADRNLAIAFVAMAAGEKGPSGVSDDDVKAKGRPANENSSDQISEANVSDDHIGAETSADVGDSVESGPGDTKTVKSILDNDPINEFTHMPQILSGAFPHEFPFGVSQDDLGGPASLKKRVLRRLTRVYDGRVSHNYHLLVYLGNMILRHKSVGATSARVEVDCSQPLVKYLNQPDFDATSKAIAKNPDGDEARALVKKVSPWVRLAGRKVPFSPMERLSSAYHLYAFYHHLGLSSYFITLAPKTLTNQLMLRFGTFQDDTQKESYEELDLPEHLQSRVKLLTSNTIAQARAYEVIVTAVCSVLFGIKPDSDCRKTHKPQPGLFGTATAYYGVTECQSRNALHAHFVVWVRALHPDIVQQFAHDATLRKRIVGAVDAVVTGSKQFYEECTLSINMPESVDVVDTVSMKNHKEHTLPTNISETLEIKVYEDIYNQLIVGDKVVDARIYYPSFRKFVPGHYIKFLNSSNPAEWFLVRMTYKKIYDCFKEMLLNEGVKDCLPNITGGINAAVKQYHSFRKGTYEALAQEHQVVAYRFTQRVSGMGRSDRSTVPLSRNRFSKVTSTPSLSSHPVTRRHPACTNSLTDDSSSKSGDAPEEETVMRAHDAGGNSSAAPEPSRTHTASDGSVDDSGNNTTEAATKTSRASPAPAFLDKILTFNFDNRELKVGDVFFDGDNGADSGIGGYTLGWVEVVAKRSGKVYLSPVYSPSPPLIAKHPKEMSEEAVTELFEADVTTRSGRRLKQLLRCRCCWEWSVSLAGKAAALHRSKVRGLLVMMAYNVHGFANGKRHTLTCRKYKDTYRAKWCRLGFGRSVFPCTDVRQIVKVMVKTQAVDSNDESDFERAVCAAVDEVESTVSQDDFAPAGCVPRSPSPVQSHINSTPEKDTHRRHGHRQTPPRRCSRRLFERGCTDVPPLQREAAVTTHIETDPGVTMPRKRKRKYMAVSRSHCRNDKPCDASGAHTPCDASGAHTQTDPHVVSPRKRKRNIVAVAHSRSRKKIGSIHPV